VDVQITKWLHLSFLFSSRLGRGSSRGALRATTWLIHYKKKHKKHRQPPSCIVWFLKILCSSCIRLILVILTCLRKRGAAVQERIRYYNFFPKHSFLSLLISCLYLSYLTLNSCFVFVLLLLLILHCIFIDFRFIDFCLEICQWRKKSFRTITISYHCHFVP
jgi:GT2 family glycosyltransferase